MVTEGEAGVSVLKIYRNTVLTKVIATACKLQMKQKRWKVICMQNYLVHFLYWLSNPSCRSLK